MERSTQKKECAKCELILSAKNFWSDKIKADGLSSYCKECWKEPRAEGMVRYRARRKENG